jgi:outer membrane protein OmpA-like peptidoglycan-associated protein
MFVYASKPSRLFFVLAFVALLPIGIAAQVASAVKGKSPFDLVPKWNIFAGYSYLSPHGTVQTLLKVGDPTQPFSYVPIGGGGIVSIARYVNKHWGWEVIGDVHLQDESTHKSSYTYKPRDQFSGGSGGVIYRFRHSGTTPFVHMLMGGEIADGPHWQLDHWGSVETVGGGMDCDTSLFKHHMAIRLVQADYQHVHENYGTGIQEGIANSNNLRLSAGAVFHSATDDSREPISLSCSANQTSIYPGQPVTVTATTRHLNPSKSVSYSWLGTGVTGNETTATVDTHSLAPGTYTVKAQVREDRPSRACLRVIPPQWADCSASFTVKPYEPPTISCIATPGTIYPDQNSTITANAVSPQNRPLTYSYSADTGAVSGNGATAEFKPSGAPLGTIWIHCNVADGDGLKTTTMTSVTIVPRPAPPVQHTQALCSITFSKDKARPTRVDNEAKACLDEIALSLQKQSDAKAVIVGNSDTKEKAKQQTSARKHNHLKVVNPADERAVNAKDYLVTEKGIDAARISVATGTTNDQKAGNYLVPSGATFSSDVTGTTMIDETALKAQPRKPLAARKHAHKKTVEE